MDNIVKIHYLLSKEGQKNSLLKGGNGRMIQEIEVPLTEELLKEAEIDEDGNAVINIGINSTVDYKIDRMPVYSERGHIVYKEEIVPVNMKYFDEPQSFESLIKYKDEIKPYIESKKEELQKLFNDSACKRKKSHFITNSAVSIIGVCAFLSGLISNILAAKIVGLMLLLVGLVQIVEVHYLR